MSTIISSINGVATARRLRVETISDAGSFRALNLEWDKLLASSSLDYPFATHSWTRTWWECFGQNRPLHIIVVREGGSVVGIAPMMEDCERLYGFKLRKLSFLWNPHVPRCDLIVQ